MPGSARIIRKVSMGALRQEAPARHHDYAITDPMDQAALDSVIYRKVCQLRQSMEPGARLYVLMGEDHDMPVHLMAQAGLLDNLALAQKNGDRQHGKLVFAGEIPYDDLHYYAREKYNLKIGKYLRTRLHNQDPLGHHFARAVLAHNTFRDAPQSLSRIFNACLHHTIPLALIDAGRNETQSHLCHTDKLACKIAQKLYGKHVDLRQHNLATDGSDRDNRGVSIRNAVMARRAVMAATQHKADTIVIGTGRFHVSGGDRAGLPYNMSMTAFLRKKIRPQDKILPVLFPHGQLGITSVMAIPYEFWRDNPPAVTIRGFNKSTYDSQSPPGSEDAFIRDLGGSYGVHVPSHFHIPATPDKETIREHLQRLIDGITPTTPEPF